ncbi:MAG: efflux RND transporter periplasmic adaptor subunit [Endomicrobia bacterium]|nr:efflux RND transporter periplasmic adaptor subunit [Endomicrobiia bacterium]MCL2506372.1 efflux RND transporter periplasmic adaptor subunit [Endomicrobiia bacterium]
MKFLKIFSVFCFSVFLVFSVSSCKNKKNVPQNAAYPVNAVKVLKTDLPFDMQYPAQLAGSLEIQIRAQVGGILKAMLYQEGSYVTGGTQLFQIDDEPYKIALEKAQAIFEQAQSVETQTKNDYKRMEYLHKRNSISQKDYDDAVAAYKSAQANVKSAQAEVDNAKMNLKYTKVAAPISGLTGISIQSIGSLILPAGDSGLLTTMVQTDPMFINFSIPSNQFVNLAKEFTEGKIITDEKNVSPILVQIVFSDGSAYPENAKIVFFDNSENPDTSSILVRAVLPNPQGQRLLIPGHFVRVNLLGVSYKDELVVPDSAVLETPAGAIAYVINQNSILEARPVKGQLKNGVYMIASGLNEGDNIVLDGLIKVRPGEKVTPVMKEFAIQVKDKNQPETAANIPGSYSQTETEVIIKDIPVSQIPLVSGSVEETTNN